MAESHITSQLKQLRAECLGELKGVGRALADLELKEAAMLERLQHVDSVIR